MDCYVIPLLLTLTNRSERSQKTRCPLRRRQTRNPFDSPPDIRKGATYTIHLLAINILKLLSHQIVLAHLILYNPATALAKISILLLYRRIFPNPRLLIVLWTVGAFVVCYCTAQFFVLLIQCRPIRAAWDPTVPNPTCVRVNTTYIIIGAFNALTDIVTLCIPMPMLWRLQISRERKAQLIGMFMLGGL